MFILDSLEVRWFVPPGDPAERALKGKFGAVPVEDDGRADWYLRTDSDALGVKSRTSSSGPARLETKFRLGALGPTELAPGIVGAIEQWRKLSTTTDDTELLHSGEWLRIAKARRLRKLAYDNGQLTEVPPGARPAVGCGVELTELHYTVHERPSVATTFGLEAVGTGGDLLEALLRSARAIATEQTGLGLRAEWSMGYPRWLQRMS